MTSVLNSLLSDLRSRGVELQVSGGRLVVDAPAGTLTENDRAALSVSKPSILRRLAAEARVLAMSLKEFEQAGFAIEIRVPWLPHTLWWVPRTKHVAGVLSHNVERGRVYTAKELTNLTNLTACPDSRAEIQGIARLKLAFNATVLALVNASDPANRACAACRERRFWRSIHGVVVCGLCHPPAALRLVERWLTEPENDVAVDPEMAS